MLFCTFASRGGNHYELAEYVLQPNHATTTTTAGVPDASGNAVASSSSAAGSGGATVGRELYAVAPLSSPRTPRMMPLPRANTNHPLHKLYNSGWFDDGTIKGAAVEVCVGGRKGLGSYGAGMGQEGGWVDDGTVKGTAVEDVGRSGMGAVRRHPSHPLPPFSEASVPPPVLHPTSAPPPPPPFGLG